MSLPFLGEIRLLPYNFAPTGWASCNGQLLLIGENDALFSLIGTTYGGDGQNTFALPDLRGRAVFGRSSASPMGMTQGVESVALTQAQLPSHNHALAVSGLAGTSATPEGKVLAHSTLASFKPFADPSSPVAMPAETIGASGGSQPHNNMMPYTVLNYCIALAGIYPSRN